MTRHEGRWRPLRLVAAALLCGLAAFLAFFAVVGFAVDGFTVQVPWFLMALAGACGAGAWAVARRARRPSPSLDRSDSRRDEASPLALAVLAVLLVGGFGVTAVDDLMVRQQLRSSSATTMAEVLDHRRCRVVCALLGGTTVVEYAVDGRPVRAEVTTRSWAESGTVAVRYATATPYRARLVEGDQRAYLSYGLASAAAAAGAAVMLRTSRRGRA